MKENIKKSLLDYIATKIDLSYKSFRETGDTTDLIDWAEAERELKVKAPTHSVIDKPKKKTHYKTFKWGGNPEFDNFGAYEFKMAKAPNGVLVRYRSYDNLVTNSETKEEYAALKDSIEGLSTNGSWSTIPLMKVVKKIQKILVKGGSHIKGRIRDDELKMMTVFNDDDCLLDIASLYQ